MFCKTDWKKKKREEFTPPAGIGKRHIYRRWGELKVRGCQLFLGKQRTSEAAGSPQLSVSSWLGGPLSSVQDRWLTQREMKMKNYLLGEVAHLPLITERPKLSFCCSTPPQSSQEQGWTFCFADGFYLATEVTTSPRMHIKICITRIGSRAWRHFPGWGEIKNKYSKPLY